MRWRVRVAQRSPAGSVAGCIGAGGYRNISIGNKKFRAHLLAWLYMTGEWPTRYVDHKNRITDDNRWTNLRAATRKQNNENRGLFKNNTSGATGVVWDRKANKWRAVVNHNKRRHYFGWHAEVAEAAAAAAAGRALLFTHVEQ